MSNADANASTPATAADQKETPEQYRAKIADLVRDQVDTSANDVDSKAQWSLTDRSRIPEDYQTVQGEAAQARSKQCDTNDSKDSQLRAILMDQLDEMAKKEGECGAYNCSEDKELDEMQELYKNLMGDGKCDLGTFNNSPRIKILKAMIETLKFSSYGFLHRSCEGTNNCNPYAKTVPEALLGCCGLQQGAPLFYDADLEAVGAHLAGKQGSPKSDTPASRGHCANFYPTGTIAPGRGKELYVNVCYRAKGEEGIKVGDKHVGVKWVKANRMEIAKYQTLKDLQSELTRQKKAVLSVNRKMLQLQQSLIGLVPGGDDKEDTMEDMLVDNMKMFVARSAKRVGRDMRKRRVGFEDKQEDEKLRYALFRNSKKRRAVEREVAALKKRAKSGKKKSKSKKGKKGHK